MKRLDDVYQIKMLVTMGTVVYWSNDAYRVVLSRDEFNIVHENGYTESLTDDRGELKDKANEFYIKELRVHGELIRNRYEFLEVLQRMSQEEINAKSKKMGMIRGAASLYDKVQVSKHFNREIRKMQDKYDYVQLHFWKVVDLLEGTI